jgi:hypothetical protein
VHVLQQILIHNNQKPINRRVANKALRTVLLISNLLINHHHDDPREDPIPQLVCVILVQFKGCHAQLLPPIDEGRKVRSLWLPYILADTPYKVVRNDVPMFILIHCRLLLPYDSAKPFFHMMLFISVTMYSTSYMARDCKYNVLVRDWKSIESLFAASLTADQT